MHSYPQIIGGFALAVAGLFGGVGAAQAQSHGHIDRLAVQLQRQARDLHWEATPTSAAPPYRQLDRAIAEMERLATHLHDVAERSGNPEHLRADVGKLDRLFHQVERLVDDLARFREIDRRALAHFRTALAQVGRTIHHLEDDLGGHSHGH